MSRIEGFILTGGASRRMGRDKTRLLLGGKTFVERAAFTLREIEPLNLYLVGRAEESVLNLPVLADISAAREKRGAIVGLHTAFCFGKTEWAAVLACDLPFASGSLFQRLFSLAKNLKIGRAAVVPRQPDGKLQPLCGVYKSALCLPAVEKMRAARDWRLREFVRAIDARIVEFEEISDLPNAENFFFNVNTPDDYERAAEIERIAAANRTESL